VNGKIIAALIGVVTIAFGIVGLVWPGQVMGFAQLAPLVPTQPIGALGEIRAVYGGMLVGVGIATLWAALDPVGRRPSLVLLGALWLCVFGGRMWGVVVDGNPGVMGWVNAMLELTGGVLLLVAPYMRGGAADVTPVATAASPEPY
jgi:hypothetical protein